MGLYRKRDEFLMKKILLTLLGILLCSTAHATVWYACSGGGNWNGATVWTSVIGDQIGCTGATGNPVAGDTATLNSTSGNITITAAAAAAIIDETGYAGTLAFGTQTLTLTAASNLNGAMTSTSGIISTGGNITLLATPTGTFPKITITAANTLTSGGFTWPGAVTFNVAGNVTLNGNWITSGVTTFSAATNINLTTSETYTENGGLTLSAASGSAPTAEIIDGGGTWSGTNTLANNLTFAGNSTISGTVQYRTNTLTYSSGTIITTGSTLNLQFSSVTFNTNGMTWNNITNSSGAAITITLTSNLALSGAFTNYSSGSVNGVNVTFSGAFNISMGTLNFSGQGVSITLSLVAGQTLSITSGINVYGNQGFATTIKSGTTSSATTINYSGTAANDNIYKATFTDITSSGSTLYNFNGGTLTRTSGISNVNGSNFVSGGGVGLFIQ